MKRLEEVQAERRRSDWPDVNDIIALAQVIREVDGNHNLGAAALAEAILTKLPRLVSGWVAVREADLDYVLKNSGVDENLHQSEVEKFNTVKERLWDSYESTPQSTPIGFNVDKVIDMLRAYHAVRNIDLRHERSEIHQQLEELRAYAVKGMGRG